MLEAKRNPEVNNQDALLSILQKLQAITRRRRQRFAYMKSQVIFPLVRQFKEIESVPIFGEPAIVEIVENHASPKFFNWGKTYSFTPGKTLSNGTAEQGRRVRVAGFRHTWAPLFGANGNIIIMLQPYDSLVRLPHVPAPSNWQSELVGMEVVPTVAGRQAPEHHAFCKIGAGTTNEQFREWCFENKMLTLPFYCFSKLACDKTFNVLMVEITFGGSNAPICHGSGFSSRTLSDLVMDVEYVYARGNLQVVNDPEELRAPGGCFGLLGVVVSLTLLLDDMGVAKMKPVAIDVALAIPPPRGYQLPAAITEQMTRNNITDSDLENARIDFIRRCKEDYYLEWFWFPYNEKCWINTWPKQEKREPEDNFLPPYPPQSMVKIFTNVKSQESFPSRIAWLFGQGAMMALPNITDDKDAIYALVSEALHFRRGTQNFRCLDTEWEIPIPTLKGSRWDGISAMYEKQKGAPVRVSLEMRLMGGSDVILSPQYGNQYGAVSIEVLALAGTPPKVWADFRQYIADKWTSYIDQNGNPLIARPHWPKEWSGLKVYGRPIEDYMRNIAYKSAFSDFRQVFTSVVERRGGSVPETLKVFGNDTMNNLIFSGHFLS
ncbi:hypothetical protein CPB86DRAFT_837017 [Serendipita vermifera]|nr:hypothetical protein CPB86DRAFT_837017 [Serendipita vermifera]